MPLGRGPRGVGWVLAGFRVIDGGGAAVGRLQKTAGFHLLWAGVVRGKGAERLHAVAGSDGVPHKSQLRYRQAVKTWQYSSGSNMPQ